MNERTDWYLRGVLMDNSPWIIPITHKNFTIGRQADNHLILSSSSVSRRHALIMRDQNSLFILDRESKNGVYLNGLRVEEKARLKEGDILKIGVSEFTLARYGDREEEENTMAREADGTQISFADFYGLSDREYEVLFFLIKGSSVKQIGEALFISPGTAKNHVLKIYKKTGCHSRIELATLYSDFKGMK